MSDRGAPFVSSAIDHKPDGVKAIDHKPDGEKAIDSNPDGLFAFGETTTYSEDFSISAGEYMGLPFGLTYPEALTGTVERT